MGGPKSGYEIMLAGVTRRCAELNAKAERCRKPGAVK